MEDYDDDDWVSTDDQHWEDFDADVEIEPLEDLDGWAETC